MPELIEEDLTVKDAEPTLEEDFTAAIPVVVEPLADPLIPVPEVIPTMEPFEFEPVLDGYIPYMAPVAEVIPTVAVNEWNPDFFGRNPAFGELRMQELDRAAMKDRAEAVQSGEELMVLRTPKFSIAW